MKLYSRAFSDMAEQLKASRAALERTYQKVTRSLESLEGFDETTKKIAQILREPVRKG